MCFCSLFGNGLLSSILFLKFSQFPIWDHHPWNWLLDLSVGEVSVWLFCFTAVAANKRQESPPKRKLLKDPSLGVLLGIGNRYLNIIHFRRKGLMPIKIKAHAKYLLFVLKCVFLCSELLLHLQCKCRAQGMAAGLPGMGCFCRTGPCFPSSRRYLQPLAALAWSRCSSRESLQILWAKVYSEQEKKEMLI